MGSCENWSFCETWSLYKGVKELWLFTSLNTKLGDWSLSVTGARSSAAYSLDPGEARPGTTAGLWHRNMALPGWLYVPSCESELLLLGGGRNSSSAGVGIHWSIASAGMTLVLSKPTDSLDLHLKNINCADFTFREISLMSFRHEKKNKKALSFLLNLLEKSGTPCISLFEEVLTSEIEMGNTKRNQLSLFWKGSSLSWDSSAVLGEWDCC